MFVGALVVLIAGYYWRSFTLSAAQLFLKPFPDALSIKVLGILEAFMDGLIVLPDLRRLGGVLLVTSVYWGALGVGMMVMSEAVGISDLSWLGAFALLTVLTVGIMVPAGPGFTGTFELALKAGFALLVVSAESMLLISVYAIVLHVAQLFVQVGFGVVCLPKAPLKLGLQCPMMAGIPMDPTTNCLGASVVSGVTFLVGWTSNWWMNANRACLSLSVERLFDVYFLQISIAWSHNDAP